MERQLDGRLTCERRSVYELLMICAGMMGAYTYSLRGGVFCNAQTANFVMMAMALGKGQLGQGLYYLIPAGAYTLGAILSELLPKPVKKLGFLRWDSYLVAFELLVLFIVGWIPLTAPHQIVQISINFICSMQYNTFRQAEGIPMATTFCTNHVRQLGIGIAKFIHRRDRAALRKGGSHLLMILGFLGGGVAQTVACARFGAKSIWLAMVPLAVDLALLVYADLVLERGALDRKPSGH